MKVRDYRCECGKVFEAFVNDDSPVRCSCGKSAKRLLSAPRFHLDGSRGHFPTAAMRWEREHEQAGSRNG